MEEWIIRLVQGMYANERSYVSVSEGYIEVFEVKVGVHQCSVLSMLLFIIVLEALSRKFRSGLPWEDLNADDLVIIAESLEECDRRLLTCERSNVGERTESKCKKDKVVWAWIPCRVKPSLHEPSVALEWTATASSAMAASTGCSRNAVGSSTWQRILITDAHGARKLHTPWMGDNIGKSKSKLTSWRWKLPFATKERCSQQPVAVNFQPPRVKTAWKKFKELLPVLFSYHLSFRTRGRVYSSCAVGNAPCQ